MSWKVTRGEEMKSQRREGERWRQTGTVWEGEQRHSGLPTGAWCGPGFKPAELPLSHVPFISKDRHTHTLTIHICHEFNMVNLGRADRLQMIHSWLTLSCECSRCSRGFSISLCCVTAAWGLHNVSWHHHHLKQRFCPLCVLWLA